jgi:hypothetical protein
MREPEGMKFASCSPSLAEREKKKAKKAEGFRCDASEVLTNSL